MSFLKTTTIAIIFLSVTLLLIRMTILSSYSPFFGSLLRSQHSTRKLSISLPGGDCLWTNAQPLGQDITPFGTLFASYPGSGMRVAWQQTEGITGIQVGDDFHLGGEDAYDKTGLIKTQYPHIEGIWSFDDNMDQVILLLRHPRYAIPSYHTFLSEIDYAHDWETAYQYLYDTFQTRPSQENWTKWRDYRFDDELELWKNFIDFYMENGTQYWTEWDFERNGQWPFRFYTEEEKQNNRTVDPHCLYDVDCFPVALLTFEEFMDPASGVDMLYRIADALEGKHNMTLISRDSMECMYYATFANAPFPNNTNRDINGAPPREDYGFTLDQMIQINATLASLAEKYSLGQFSTNPIAIQLVTYLEGYLNETQEEIAWMVANPGPPTTAPGPNYQNELVEWYVSLGKGDRYNKAKVQALASYWPLVQHLYENNTEMESLNPYKHLKGTYEDTSEVPPFMTETR